MPNIDYKRSFAFATFTVLFRGKLIPNGIFSISSDAISTNLLDLNPFVNLNDV